LLAILLGFREERPRGARFHAISKVWAPAVGEGALLSF